RRLIVHDSIFDEIKDRLTKIYQRVRIGDPLKEGTLVGPLIDKDAVNMMQAALKKLVEEGGTVITGGEVVTGEGFENGTYVKPALCIAENHYEIVQHETFAPILYLIKYSTLDEAMEYQNGVVQGLSSAM